MKNTKLIKLLIKDKYQRLLAGEPETCGMCSGHVILQPGESVGQHSTEAKEEVLVVIEGGGEASLMGKKIIIKKDCILYIPPFVVHDVKNSGRGVLRYVYVVSPCNL